MIPRPELAALTPAKRAEVIYAEARSQLSNRLWRAALGDVGDKDAKASPFSPPGMPIDLMQLLGDQYQAGGAGCGCKCACACHVSGAQEIPTPPPPPPVATIAASAEQPTAMVSAPAAAVSNGGLRLGVNARFGAAFAAAEARTGIPAPALAAIVDAEAAKGRDGSWNVHSRNPRSSAAGLGQFLSATWQDLAKTKGTWLNDFATRKGWIDTNGAVRDAARHDLLALRYDPQASILGIADLAKLNLDRLERGGVKVRADSETLAKAAYLSHHLGLGDAKRFLGGGLSPGRAHTLLSAQIGSSAAERRIAHSGGAVQAHRQWLLGFIADRVRPERFASVI